MAENKPKRRPKPRTTYLTHFPEVKGKIIKSVEIDAIAIVILFEDNTALSLDLDTTLSIYPELRNRRKGDWTKIKRWPAVHGSPGIVKW